VLGTLDPMKWASFVCWNGDPFNMASYPVAVYAEGELIYRDQR
jgi:imidazolonepropionase-like amidohydrolase